MMEMARSVFVHLRATTEQQDGRLAQRGCQVMCLRAAGGSSEHGQRGAQAGCCVWLGRVQAR